MTFYYLQKMSLRTMCTENFVVQNARQLCLTMKSLFLNSYSFVYFKKFLSIGQLNLTGKAVSFKHYSKSNNAAAVDYLNTAVSNTDFIRSCTSSVEEVRLVGILLVNFRGSD